MSYALFVSYARADVRHKPYKDHFVKFLDDLCALVEVKIAQYKDQNDQMNFVDDEDIELGKIWQGQLNAAVNDSKFCLAFYSPSYFVSPWCEKEFNFFFGSGIPIFPVWWLYTAELPSGVPNIQNLTSAFPQDYGTKGLLSLLKDPRAQPDYVSCVDAFADSISKRYEARAKNGANSVAVPPGQAIWPHQQNSGQGASRGGSISKTCFVYMAQNGWDRKPYGDGNKSVGALSQGLSGKLDLRYEEIPCDVQLNKKLDDNAEANIPTLLLVEPSALNSSPFKDIMHRYDKQFLLNCGSLLAWPENAPNAQEADPLWASIKTICPQKISQPPPNHEWRNIFSSEDLNSKALAVLENIRLGLLNKVLSDKAAPVRKAESLMAVASAAALGISLKTTPELGNNS